MDVYVCVFVQSDLNSHVKWLVEGADKRRKLGHIVNNSAKKKTTYIFIVAPFILKIHWVLHTNKCTNCISYISLKLFTLKHFYCSYMFR
jgi:hypothetical protein